MDDHCLLVMWRRWHLPGPQCSGSGEQTPEKAPLGDLGESALPVVRCISPVVSSCLYHNLFLLGSVGSR